MTEKSADDGDPADVPSTRRRRPSESRPASITDVARAADVSVPTVSRVLTGAARVSPERRARVLQAIEDLHFQPSSTARALVSGRRDQIAVMTSDTATHGYSATIKGIETGARADGAPVVISVIDRHDAGEVERAVQVALQLPLAGIVVLKFDPIGVEVLDAVLASTRLPIVAVSGEADSRVSQVMFDEEAGAAELVEHLLDQGHRTVHHVTVPPSRSEDGRTTGWRQALASAGAPIPDIIPADSFGPASGLEIGRRLAQDPEVTAVFCGNDEVAMGLIAGIEAAGRGVPGDISVVGFDDHPLAEYWRPGLTTVHQDFQDLGGRAYAMLKERMEDPEASVRLSKAKPWLVERGSVGRPPR